MHRVDTIVSDERNKVEEKSHVKQALTINGYPEWLINSIPTIQPSLESTTSVSRDDTGDHSREIDKQTRNLPVRTSQYCCLIFKEYWNRSGARFTKDLRCILHPKLGRKMIFAKKLCFTNGS